MVSRCTPSTHTVYLASRKPASDQAWESALPREQPSDSACAEGTEGFAGRFVGTLEDGGDTIAGLFQVSFDDVNWQDDLVTAYRHVATRS